MDDIPEMPDEEPFPEFEPALKRMMARMDKAVRDAGDEQK